MSSEVAAGVLGFRKSGRFEFAISSLAVGVSSLHSAADVNKRINCTGTAVLAAPGHLTVKDDALEIVSFIKVNSDNLPAHPVKITCQ